MSCVSSSCSSSAFGHRRLITCLALLLLIWASPGAADPHSSSLDLPAEDEPITPVPQPPSADPLKLALGSSSLRTPDCLVTGHVRVRLVTISAPMAQTQTSTTKLSTGRSYRSTLPRFSMRHSAFGLIGRAISTP